MARKTDKQEMISRIKTEEDYIRAPKFGNSLKKFLSKNDEELEDAAVARLLMISEEEVKELYNEAVSILRKNIGEENAD